MLVEISLHADFNKQYLLKNVSTNSTIEDAKKMLYKQEGIETKFQQWTILHHSKTIELKNTWALNYVIFTYKPFASGIASFNLKLVKVKKDIHRTTSKDSKNSHTELTHKENMKLEIENKINDTNKDISNNITIDMKKDKTAVKDKDKDNFINKSKEYEYEINRLKNHVQELNINIQIRDQSIIKMQEELIEMKILRQINENLQYENRLYELNNAEILASKEMVDVLNLNENSMKILKLINYENGTKSGIESKSKSMIGDGTDTLNDINEIDELLKDIGNLTEKLNERKYYLKSRSSKKNKDSISNNNNNDSGHTRLECSICMDNPINMIMKECKHVCICSECAKREIKTCPICKTKVTAIEPCYIP